MMANRCIRLAGIYLLIGMTLGIAMGASENFALRPVHAHVNLLGWVGLALAAGVFKLWPEFAGSRLATAFFWLYNGALPPMLGALALLLLGHPGALPILVAGELGVYGATLLFVVGLFQATGARRRAGRLAFG